MLHIQLFKKMISLIIILTAVIGSNALPQKTLAQELTFKASLAAMPQSAEINENGELSGAYVELVRALDRLTNTKTDIDVVPFKRSVINLINGRADYHIPLIQTPGANLEKLPYAFSTETLFQVSFVLYTNKDRPLDVNNLDQYSILTDSAHTDFFPFEVEGTACLTCAIKMVNVGRIDGFIFAQNEIDPFIRQFKLTDVHRQLYKNFDVKIVIPKGDAGRKIDQYFSSGIKTLRDRGQYDELLAPVLAPYREWQP
jgi:polar amino acid transport system substrate-binding protein